MPFGKINSNFINNNASNLGGAVFFWAKTDVTNCNFTGNNASVGSAIYLYKSYSSKTLTISNSTLLNNKANVEALKLTKNENNITITFMGQNNLLNAIYSRNDEEVTFTNVTYWGANGITNTDEYYPSISNMEAGQNITVKGFVNGNILNTVQTTDADGKIVLENVIGDYWILVRHDDDSYYTEAETVKTNMKFYVNVTETKTTDKKVNITAKSNIYNEVMPGELLFILPDGTGINATYASNGTWWAEHTFEGCGDYQINASYIGLDNVTVSNATISVLAVDLSVNITSDKEVYFIGDEVVWTITVHNAGNGTDATGVLLQEYFPSRYFRYTAHFTNNGTYNNESEEWDIGFMAGELTLLCISLHMQ